MPLQLTKNLAFIDLETTGKDVNIDRIVEICIHVLLAAGGTQTYKWLINPVKHIPAEATAVHGITNEMISEMPTFKDVARDILEIITGCDIAGFNSNVYDVPLLYNELYRAGLSWNWREHAFIDVMNIYRKYEERTLSAAVRFYLGREHEGAHGAEADIIATSEILIAQIEKYGLSGSVSDLAELSSTKIVDIAGKFKYNDQGEIILAFGKHAGELAKNNRGFLEWMYYKKPDIFNTDTLNVVAQILGIR